MSLKPLHLSVLSLVVLAMLAPLSACGKKGDPIRPGEEPAEQASL